MLTARALMRFQPVIRAAGGASPSGRRGRRGRRGLSLAGAAAATAVLALIAAEWAEIQGRILRRASAEALAADVAARARSYDAWLAADAQHEENTAFPMSAEGQPGAPDSPPGPRPLSAAELAAAADPASLHAAPWETSNFRISVSASPPAGTDWRLNYAVGWPDGTDADPAAAGLGPPHGAMILSPLTAKAERELDLTRAALNSRGGAGTADAGERRGGEFAALLAAAAGLDVPGNAIAVPAWSFSRIPPWYALRRARAGLPPPGTDDGLRFGPDGGLEAGRIESVSAVVGGAKSIPADPDRLFPAGLPFTGLTALSGEAREIEAEALTVGGDAAADSAAFSGGAEAGSWASEGQTSVSGLTEAAAAAIGGDAALASLAAEGLSVSGNAEVRGGVRVSGRTTAVELDASLMNFGVEVTVRARPGGAGSGLLWTPVSGASGRLTVTPGAKCAGCLVPPDAPMGVHAD